MAAITTITEVFAPTETLAEGADPDFMVAAFTCAGPASYDTGGSSLDIKTLCDLPNEPVMVVAQPKQTSATRPAYDCFWDHTNKKLCFYDVGTNTQVAGTTNLSGVTVSVFAFAKRSS